MEGAERRNAPLNDTCTLSVGERETALLQQPMSKLTDYLFIGNKADAGNFEELHRLGITHVLNVTKEVPNFFEDRFCYMRIDVYDDGNSSIGKHLLNAVTFIGEPSGLAVFTTLPFFFVL